MRLFFKSKENMGDYRDAAFSQPVAGKALPWKLNGFGPECAHVPLFTVDCFIFKSG